MATKVEPVFSSKAVLTALEGLNLVEKGYKKYRLATYDGWKDKIFTRGRFTIYIPGGTMVSYFVHLSKNQVKVWLPANAKGPADHILEGNFGS